MVKLAFFQANKTSPNIKENIDKIQKQVINAYKKGANIIVFPELFLSGYDNNSFKKSALKIPDKIPFNDALNSLSKIANIAIQYNMDNIWFV